MRAGFYPNIAINGIKQNKRLYVPYILTCAGMVMMNYIISFLSMSTTLDYIGGGYVVRSMLSLGIVIIVIFSVIFLFYTNSFLIKRRKKEFGLYNILGMGKKNLGLVLFWESLICSLISLVIGLVGGIAFSKLAELGLINMLGEEIDYDLSISFGAIFVTLCVFAVIFLLIFLNGIRQIHTNNPIELLKSENVGEKPPKANWLLGLLGVVILAAAYYIAVKIENPLSALTWFFVAVAMVIVATNLLFISGSVLLCRILQKKKGYYYKANHFVSVSSMMYRMKRNGAGLATICILATMVMVMITGSGCLYFGAEDSLSSRYPNDIGITARVENIQDFLDNDKAKLETTVDEVIAKNGLEVVDKGGYGHAVIASIFEGDTIMTDYQTLGNINIMDTDKVRNVYFVALDEYNEVAEEKISLGPNQTMVYTERCKYDYDTMTIQNGNSFEVVEKLDDFPVLGEMKANVMPSIVFVIRDYDAIESLSRLEYNGLKMLNCKWYMGVDIKDNPDGEIEASKEIAAAMQELKNDNVYSYSTESLEANREDFYGTYGGLFFLGIMLSIVFIFATTLIIYYKQISEGYEDQSRFEIMQKVGMTKQGIRRSIRSQMLTVFFLPLSMAVIHLAFAFPMIRNLLMLFSLQNLPLLLLVAALSVLSFGIFYIVVYKITTGAYYKIVSGARSE